MKRNRMEVECDDGETVHYAGSLTHNEEYHEPVLYNQDGVPLYKDKRRIGFIGLLVATLLSFPAHAIDLTNWKLTLPVDSRNGFTGKAVEYKQLGNVKNSEFFRNSDGLIFRVPSNGATTSGSKYPRSELREMKNGTEYYWTTAQGGELTATLEVDELPVTKEGKKGRIVIGQIHGPDDELCRLYYDNGTLYFYDDKAGSKRKETKFVLKSPDGKEPQIKLDEKFDYSILVKGGYLTVQANYKGVTYKASEKIGSFWKGKKLYFKAGVYSQVGRLGSKAGTTGTGYAQATFYDIDMRH